MTIIGIPTTRVSDLFIRQRILNQVQADQLAMYKILGQLSTGHRLDAPSEDPVAAMRIISLQSLLERKQQVTLNLATAQSFLSASDSALTNVSSMLAEVRAATLGVMGTTASDVQRRAAAQEVAQALRQLVDTGNQQFRGRYIFAGSTNAAQPLDYVGTSFVQYSGNDQSLVTYGDVDMLLQTNLSSVEAFGSISTRVCGLKDLNPVLSYDTRVADLRGGRGLSRGSIAISDGVNTSIVNLSGAETVGDLAALIQANPPQGRTLQVDVTPTRLVITLDSSTAGALSIREVGGGTVAEELGLLREIGSGKTIEGRDLDPVLRTTTSLNDIFGVRARAVVRSSGSDDNIIVEADRNGATTADGRPLNGVTVSFVNDVLVEPGKETVVYNGSDSIVVHIAEKYTQAKHVVAAINAAYAAGTIPFTARLDPLDSRWGGRGTVDVEAAGVTQYGAGEDFDNASGLRIVNRGEEFAIAFPLAETIEDLLNALNGAGAGIVAEINATRTGIDLRSRVSGCDFTIGENGGKTATQLGLRSFTLDTRLDDLNFGRGVDDWPGSGQRASAVYDSGVANSSLTFKARHAGSYYNGFDITFTSTLAAPSINYDPDAKKLEFQVNAATTANDIIALVRKHPEVSADWDVSLTPNEGSGNNGTGKVAAGSAVTDGGDDTGVDFTITCADGTEMSIDLAEKRTIGDVINAINNHPSNKDGRLVAQLAVYGNGIELVDLSEGDQALRVTRSFFSQAAVDLGLVPPGADQSDAAAEGGYATTTIESPAAKSGLVFSAKAGGTAANGVRVVFQDGGPPSPVYDAVGKTLTFGINLGVTTAQDVVTMLAGSPLGATFSATFDPTDDSGNDGTGFVAATDPLAPPRMAGGTATEYARTTVVSAGFDNDLVFASKALGTAQNNTAIRFVEAPGGPTQVVSFNPGVELVIQFDPGVSRANDVIAAVAAHPAADATFAVTCDPADASPNDGSGLVAETLGTEPAMSGGQQTITGRDVNPLETESLFTALVRIQQGLETNDLYLIERSLQLLERKSVDLNFSRAGLGARQQAIDVLKDRLDVEDVDLNQALSLDYDADLADVAAQLASRQAAFEAALQAMAKIHQMTLLDYL